MCCMMMHAMDHSGHEHASQGESPLEILRRRYALGEVNAAQFEEMKRVLGLSSSEAVQASTGIPSGHDH